jgi:glyoxylate reductase
MQHRVFVTRKLPGTALLLLKRSCHVEVWTKEVPPDPQIICQKVAGVDGLLSLLTDRIDADVLDAAAPGLKVISNYAVGYDNIDIPAATSRGIPVGHTPGVLTETTADLAFALMMTTARRLVEGAACSKNGEYLAWSPRLLLGQDVFGATLGIVGMGRIGKAMVRRAAGFGMKVIYSAIKPPPLAV